MSTLSMASSRIWLNSSDPGVSEPDIDQGNLWLNTTDKSLIANVDPTMGAQVWSQVVLGTQVQYLSANVDGLVTGDTVIFTTAAGTRDYYVTSVLVVLESVTGIAAGSMAYTIGFNGPTFDNVVAGDSFNGTNAGEFNQADFAGAIVTRIPPSTAVSLNVTIAEATATSYQVKVFLLGNYL